jgi:hypothetical protein
LSRRRPGRKARRLEPYDTDRVAFVDERRYQYRAKTRSVHAFRVRPTVLPRHIRHEYRVSPREHLTDDSGPARNAPIRVGFRMLPPTDGRRQVVDRGIMHENPAGRSAEDLLDGIEQGLAGPVEIQRARQ